MKNSKLKTRKMMYTQGRWIARHSRNYIPSGDLKIIAKYASHLLQYSVIAMKQNDTISIYNAKTSEWLLSFKY